MKIRILSIALSFFFFSTSIKLAAQSNGQLYTLGVQMGLACTQASIAISTESNRGSIDGPAFKLAMEALKGALITTKAINTAYNGPTLFLDFHPLAGLVNSSSNNTQPKIDISLNKKILENFYSRTLSVRNSYTKELAELHKDAISQLHAYLLGVNLAIAEAQASVGEAARQIVSASLAVAKNEAQVLSLDTSRLDECIALLKGTTAIQTVYTKISAIRVSYQSGLSQ